MAHRILIVEDDHASRRALSFLFARLGLVPIEAGCIAEAMEKLSRRPDVVCLDLMLPDGNGASVLRHIREEQMSCKVAVISAANDPAMLAEVTSLRPDALFGKPLNIEDFLDWLKSIGLIEPQLRKHIARPVLVAQSELRKSA